VALSPLTRARAALLAASVAIVAAGRPSPLAAQLHGQTWEVTPETGRATVGDTVAIRFRVRLDERDLLFDTVPRPTLTPPDWLQIISVEKLQRQPDRIFTGRALVAFYRPGRQAVPIFELPFMRSVKGLERGTFRSDTATVEIVPVLPAGSSTLRDIKEPAPRPGPNPLELLAAIVALAVAAWLLLRGGRSATTAPAPPPPAPAPPPPPDPFELALARLAAVEAERWATRDVAHHYEAVTDALRDYLEALGIPARERTTTELAWTLPPRLFEGALRDRYGEIFGDADLVKFAHWRPDPGTAAAFLAEAGTLLREWRALEAEPVAAAAREGGWR
jgi:hypothetical protein